MGRRTEQGLSGYLGALSPPAAAIYTAETDGHLSTCNPRGIVEKRYPIDTTNTPPRQVLVHPQGRRLLFLTAKPAYWIELPQ